MNKFKVTLLIVSLIFLGIFSYLVLGTAQGGAGNIYPANASTITSSRAIQFEVNLSNIDTNGIYGCQYQIGLANGTYFGNTNLTMVNTSWNRFFNASTSNLNMIDSNTTNWHNWTVYCNHTSDSIFYNVFNFSGYPKDRFFRLNTIIPTINSPANATVYNYNFTLNITINSYLNNATQYNCTYNLGLSDGTEGSTWQSQQTGKFANFTNVTSTKNAYRNSTAFNVSVQNAYNTWHNITFRCNDIGMSDYQTSSTILFGIDSTNPTIENESVAIYNATSGGNYLTLDFDITDQNPSRRRTCR